MCQSDTRIKPKSSFTLRIFQHHTPAESFSLRSRPHCWQIAHFKINPGTFNRVVQTSQCCQSKIPGLKKVSFWTICRREVLFSYHAYLWLGYGELAQSCQRQLQSHPVPLKTVLLLRSLGNSLVCPKVWCGLKLALRVHLLAYWKSMLIQIHPNIWFLNLESYLK